MKLGLGIDTGGTYTDTVIYDFDSSNILAEAKALTTKEELSLGIINSLKNALEHSNIDPSNIQLVSLSTTLATNACVEDKGGRGTLILIGYDAKLLTKLRSQYGLPDTNEMILIPGGHNQQGQVIDTPDWDKLKALVIKNTSHTDAYGVVEYWGIRNPEFEQEAKKKIRKWTGKPVVCASELSTEINSLRRASTTLLNAQLVTLIDDLLEAVKMGMSDIGIEAPIMVVKGDGTLMSESHAKERPVETLLSGPAASVVGGMNLSNCNDALILDIGGTTSDLAILRNGFTVLSEEGVDIGNWRTGTKAIKIKTIGLGGDSIISFDNKDNIIIGPRKAAPLSWLATKYPETKDILKEIKDANKWHTISLGEIYYLIQNPTKDYLLVDDEINIIKALSSGPKSITALAEQTGTSIFTLKTESLERHGIIGKGALTPSDLMHINGDYNIWDTDSALYAAEIMANRLHISVSDLIDKVHEQIIHKLYNLIVKFLLNRNMISRKNRSASRHHSFSKDALSLIDISFSNPYNEIKMNITSPLTIIGIGAPTHIYIKDLAKALGTDAIISENASVANALGAITGTIVGEETVEIKPRYDSAGIDDYSCHSSGSYFETDDYDKAILWGKEIAKKNSIKKAKDMGATDISVDLDIKHSNYKDNKLELFMGTTITARAVGNYRIFSA